MGSTRIGDYWGFRSRIKPGAPKMHSDGVLINGLTITGHTAAIERFQKLGGI